MKPNIIFYLSDQQRYDTLASAGLYNDVMPNLDRLAEQGINFTNCYTSQPVCGPARACLQSGKYATEVNHYQNGCMLSADTDTIAKYLKCNNYNTAYIGKWHLVKKQPFYKYDVPKKYRGGYDYWLASNLLEFTSQPNYGYLFDTDNKKVKFNSCRVDVITDYAIDYISNIDKSSPFFLMISQLEPHHQNDKFRFIGQPEDVEKYKNHAYPTDLLGLKGDYQQNYADYLACVNRIDQNIGKLEKYLKENDLWANTVLIYSSDHGCHFKTRNGEYKRSCHDASIHIPFVITGGAIEKIGRCDELVSLVDIPSTILSLGGVDIPKGYRGLNTIDIAKGKVKARDNVFVQISESEVGRAIRTKQYKYCVGGGKSYNEISKHAYLNEYNEEYLYDLSIDKAEHNNLIDNPDYLKIKRELRNILLKYIKEVEGKTPIIKER